MLNALIAALMLLGSLLLVAVTIRQASSKFGKSYPFAVNLVLALAIYLILFGWTAHLNLKIHHYFYIGFFVILICWNLVSSRVFFTQLRIEINKYFLATTAFLVFTIGDLLLILNGSLKSQRFTFRNGPDLFGWTISSQHFCEGKTISDLSSSVLSQANDSPISSLFKLNPIASAEHIYRIPSLTDQISAEFILGSKRFAIQNYLGSWCEFSNKANILSIIVGFIILNSFLQFLLIRRIGLLYKATEIQAVSIASLSVLGLNVLSPLIEGGLGQYLSCTFLLALWLLLESGPATPKSVAIPIVIAGLALSYFDGIIFALVFLTIFSFLHFKKRFSVSRFLPTFKTYFSISLFSIVISFPVSKDLTKLLLDRLNGHRGGWNQGRLPFPADLLGFSNWLPADSLSITKVNWIAILANLFLIFIVLQFKFLLKIEGKFRSILATFFLIYLYFLVDVYVRNSAEINNYNLLKYGMYLMGCNVVLFIIFTDAFKKKLATIKTSRSKNLLESRLLILVIIGLFVSFIASTINFQSQYFQNRKYTLDLESNLAAQDWFRKYDILVYGFPNPGAPQLAILGDLHYGASTRGFGLSTKFSEPKRELVAVTPKNYCAKNSCEFSAIGKRLTFKQISSTDDLTLYKLEVI